MEPYVTSRERYFRILDSKKGALGIVDVHVQSRTFQLGNNRDIIKAVIYKWANFPVHALLGRGQLADAYMRIDVAGMQHWPGRGPRLLPRNVHASTPTTLLTFSWSKRKGRRRRRKKERKGREKRKKEGKEKGKKVVRLYVYKRRSPWVCADDKVPCSTSSADIRAREVCTRARARDS